MPLPALVGYLRHNWGVSKQAQVEGIDDQYPVVCIPGKTLAEEANRIIAAAFGGGLNVMVEALVEGHSDAVRQRRPEEIFQA